MQRKSLSWFSVALVAGLLGAWIWWQTRPEPIRVNVSAVETGRVEKTVSNTRSGTVKACRRAKLSPSTGGQIDRLPVREGDHVDKNALLLELWNRDLVAETLLLQQEVTAAAATARAACIKAEQIRREADRLRQLGKRKLLSEDEVDRAVAAAEAGAADCESARAGAAVHQARLSVIAAQLEKTRLLAPFAGVIAEINGELNEYVTPSPPGIPTPPAIDLIDNSCFYVTAPIDEIDVADISVGQLARITLDAFGDRQLEGRVRRIANYVLDREKQARTVEVEVAFVEPEQSKNLLAGYSADVEVVLDIREDALRIPAAAVIDNRKVYVFHVDGDWIEARDIKTGVGNWDFIEVVSGLDAGELVVTNVDVEGLADEVPAKLDEAASDKDS